MANPTAATTSTATLRRYNSISTTSVVVPNKLSPPHRTSSFQAPQNQNAQTRSSSLVNLELVSLTSPLSYTSLRDVLPSTTSAVSSPTSSTAAIISSGYEISIRNRLVKQAAWAYLQPMSASPNASSAPHFLRRLCHRFTTFLSFIKHHLLPACTRVFYRMLHCLRGQVSS